MSEFALAAGAAPFPRADRCSQGARSVGQYAPVPDDRTRDATSDAAWEVAKRMNVRYAASPLTVKRHRVHSLVHWRVTEGLRLRGEGTAQFTPIRWKRHFARTWHDVRSVADAASIVGARMREREASAGSVNLRRPERWIKRLEGAPASVGCIAAGPPELALNNRAQFLATLRRTMADNGFEVSHLRRGVRHRIVLDGAQALEVIQSQEERADAQRHWWVHDIVWRSRDGGAVVCVTDWDGNDLLFFGWGEGADACLSSVASVLRAHVDGPK